MKKIPFVILRGKPDDLRGEVINVGLVVFLENGPSVYFDAPLHRLRALHPDFELINPKEWTRELEDVLSQLPDSKTQLAWLSGSGGPIKADSTPGFIHPSSQEDITDRIEDLLERLVRMPERHVTRQLPEQTASLVHLNTRLKTWFRTSRVFSSKAADLSKGRVISSYPVDVADDLYADFAFKNDVVHIIETIDFRGVEKITKSVRGEVGIKAVVLDSVRRNLSSNSRRIAVTAASDYGAVKSMIHLVSHYADDVIALESTDDRQRLADFVATNLRVSSGLLPLQLEVA